MKLQRFGEGDPLLFLWVGSLHHGATDVPRPSRVLGSPREEEYSLRWQAKRLLRIVPAWLLGLDAHDSY
jgi:hypothetical protein